MEWDIRCCVCTGGTGRRVGLRDTTTLDSVGVDSVLCDGTIGCLFAPSISTPRQRRRSIYMTLGGAAAVLAPLAVSDLLPERDPEIGFGRRALLTTVGLVLAGAFVTGLGMLLFGGLGWLRPTERTLARRARRRARKAAGER